MTNIFSYDGVNGDKRCHMPHDSATSRTDYTGISGRTQSGFTSYFMTDHSTPSYTPSVSIADYAYWKTAEDNTADNYVIDGVDSASDCHTYCDVMNDGNCWIFRCVDA